MTDQVRILGIAGSLRRASYNRGALRAAADLLVLRRGEQHRVSTTDALLQRNDLRGRGNYSVPGILKNAIDWASRPYGDGAWNGKPAGIMGASAGGIATARAQYHLRQMMVFLNMFPLNQPEVMIANAGQRFDAGGNLTDESTKEYIRKLLAALADWTRRLQKTQPSG